MSAEPETFAIPANVIDQVTAALNAAIALSMMKEPTLHAQMMAAGIALDDAVNDQPDDDDGQPDEAQEWRDFDPDC